MTCHHKTCRPGCCPHPDIRRNVLDAIRAAWERNQFDTDAVIAAAVRGNGGLQDALHAGKCVPMLYMQAATEYTSAPRRQPRTT